LQSGSVELCVTIRCYMHSNFLQTTSMCGGGGVCHERVDICGHG
jgi:hypothetical protein